ncbi:MAG TPA: type II toxin-antitoxin system death-on-curing family toxin [Patescibacteria group bacterium]
MTKKLLVSPKIWLNLQLCKSTYNVFKAEARFEEPLPEFDTRYPNRLESILGSVEQTFDGQLLYPTVAEAAAAYFQKIICEHPFVNGNKRTAVLYTDVFLFLNGFQWKLPYQDMYYLAVRVADTDKEKRLSETKIRHTCLKILNDFAEPI